MQQQPVVVIGGGLIGLLTARELLLAGRSVVLLEQGEPGRESSWAGGGILSPLYPWRYPDAVNRLAQWSQQHYPQLCRELAATGNDPEYQRSGLLMPGLDSQQQQLAQQWAQRFTADLQLLDGAECAACEPALHDPQSALWLPEVAQVRNPRLLQALQRDLAGRDWVLQRHTTVHALRYQDHRVTGVVTTGGEEIESSEVVVCAGAWSGALMQQWGITLPVAPVRGQMLLFRAEPGLLQRIVLIGDRYIIPRRDGRILVGSTMEQAGFDKTPTVAARDALMSDLEQLFPQLLRYPLEQHWAGLRPGSPDGIPFIGPVIDRPGLYVNAGQFRNGVVMGLASARLLADLLLQRPPIIPPEPYALPIG